MRVLAYSHMRCVYPHTCIKKAKNKERLRKYILKCSDYNNGSTADSAHDKWVPSKLTMMIFLKNESNKDLY